MRIVTVTRADLDAPPEAFKKQPEWRVRSPCVEEGCPAHQLNVTCRLDLAYTTAIEVVGRVASRTFDGANFIIASSRNSAFAYALP